MGSRIMDESFVLSQNIGFTLRKRKKDQRIFRNVNGTTKKRGKIKRPRFQKRYVYGIVTLFVVCIVLGVIQVVYHLTGASLPADRDALYPPNPVEALPPSYSKLHNFKKGSVCSDGPPCSKIGRDILARQGSAVDAAIATMFCNGIENMQSMGLGGGFIMTVYSRRTRSAVTLNARDVAPSLAKPDMFGKNTVTSKKGPLAIGVPGELRGYWEAHRRFGVLPWADLVQPTLDLCTTGYNMSKALWDALHTNKDVKSDATLRDVFVDPETGEYFPAGRLIYPPSALCTTLKIVAEKGGNELYNGTLAKLLVEDLKEMGSIITAEDLDKYRALWADPIKVELQNRDILYSAPPPGSGVLVGFILNILQFYNFTPYHMGSLDNSVLTLHRIIEAFKYAYAKRTELGDPAFVNIKQVVKNLTSTAYAHTIFEKINDSFTSQDQNHYGAVFYNQPDHGTAHISVLAPNGDAVSVTSTVNFYFGCSLTSKQTGIVLNNGMDDFSSPHFLNYFGLPGSPANNIEPGKRAMSSMSPSIIVDGDGNVKMVVGAAGGTKITTAIAMVIMRHLWFGQNIKEAVDAPRIHHQLVPMQLSYEYGVLDQVVQGLQAKGHIMSRFRDRGSVICAMAANKSGIYANADYRKGGDVFGLN